MTNNIRYTVTPYQSDFIFTILEPEKYKGTPVKIVGLGLDEDGSTTFEMELPSNKIDLQNDNDFVQLVQDMVGESLQKSINAMYNTQKDLLTIEDKTSEILRKHEVSFGSDKTMLESFMEKGYLLKLEEGKVYAFNTESGKGYDLSNDDEFKEVWNNVFPVNLVIE